VIEYLRIKAERQQIARAWRPGNPVPDIAYSTAEHELWRNVFGTLSSLHEDLACAQYRQSARRVALPTDYVPQLAEVSARLLPLTGFYLVPAAGVVPSQQFYGPFSDGVFQATQYLRPVSALFHSSEPDVIHELVGHAAMFADPQFAAIYRWFGEATKAASGSDEAMAALAKLFWFSLEAGVLIENGRPYACGAAILSSVAELESFRQVELREFRAGDIVVHEFDDKECQPVLFAADSADQLAGELNGFLPSLAHRVSISQ
jgi:phenylalanine-4-hydroxylase